MRLTETRIRRIVRRTLLESGTQDGIVDPYTFKHILVKILEQIDLPENIQAVERAVAFQKLAEQDREIKRLVSYYELITRALVAKISPGLVMPPVTEELVINVILNSVEDVYHPETGALEPREPIDAEDIAGQLISSRAAHIISAVVGQFRLYIRDNPELTQDEMRAAGRELRDKLTRIGAPGSRTSALSSMYANKFDNDLKTDNQIQIIRGMGGHIVR